MSISPQPPAQRKQKSLAGLPGSLLRTAQLRGTIGAKVVREEGYR